MKLGQAYGALEIRVILIIIETTFRDKCGSINDSVYRLLICMPQINLIFSFDKGQIIFY